MLFIQLWSEVELSIQMAFKPLVIDYKTPVIDYQGIKKASMVIDPTSVFVKHLNDYFTQQFKAQMCSLMK